mmetsp:Transcript_12393/g.35997  ORF Transcript_12393/g.35997 Transcript_12393/m.35997 type:complete len:104 (+) Transcript_12393:2027-2338(+)
MAERMFSCCCHHQQRGIHHHNNNDDVIDDDHNHNTHSSTYTPTNHPSSYTSTAATRWKQWRMQSLRKQLLWPMSKAVRWTMLAVSRCFDQTVLSGNHRLRSII